MFYFNPFPTNPCMFQYTSKGKNFVSILRELNVNSIYLYNVQYNCCYLSLFHTSVYRILGKLLIIMLLYFYGCWSVLNIPTLISYNLLSYTFFNILMLNLVKIWNTILVIYGILFRLWCNTAKRRLWSEKTIQFI